MKNFLIAAVASLAGLAAQAQNTEMRKVSGFKNIEAGQGIEVIFTQSDTTSVRVETGNNVSPGDVVTERKGNTLKIHMREAVYGEKTQLHDALKVYVSQNELTGIEVKSGALFTTTNEVNVPEMAVKLSSGAAFCGRLRTEKCSITSASGASFKGRLYTGSLKTSILGGANVKLIGSADFSSIYCSGGSLIAPNFTTETATIDARNSSSVHITVNTKISADSDATSAITYYGHPEKTVLGDNTYATARN